MSRFWLTMVGVIVMATASMAEPGRGERITGQPFATRSPVIAEHGMAATAQPLATQVALDILKRGGSAVDAAIGANAVLGLMEPVACGIGGDLFAFVWDPKTGRVLGLNASGRSPRGQSLEDLKRRLDGAETMPRFGSLSVSVPGTVDGWFELHGKFGKLPMEEILAPAIRYAREGFPVSQTIAFYWERNMARLDEIPEIEEFKNASETYLIAGKAPAEGERFANPALARTYEIIASKGRDAFYEGELAQGMDAYFKRIGGPLRLEDFAAHKSEWLDPPSVDYRGVAVYGLPPNTQGLATLQMLNILEGFDMAALKPGSAQSLHLMIEAKRLVFADVARYYADPAFTPFPQDWLLSKPYAAERRALIRKDAVLPDIGPGIERLMSDTTYFTVADKDGMMISIIQSNFRGMGSGLVPDGLGFMFQNRGELFSLEDGHPNLYAPGKRPFHTIIPGFATKDGAPWLSFGVMGGDMQPQGQVQILINMIDYGMNVQEAGDFARFHHGQGWAAGKDARPGYGELELEGGIDAQVRAELARLGHHITEGKGGFGGYQAIWRDPKTGFYWGASEMRKDGGAQGY